MFLNSRVNAEKNQCEEKGMPEFSLKQAVPYH